VYFLLKLFFQFLNSWLVSTNEAIRFEEEIALAAICVSEWYYTEIIQKVSLQEIVRCNIALNVAPILLLVLPLILDRTPPPPSAGTTKSQRRVGTRKRQKKKKPELAIVR
jgi:hypothetical protein